MALRTATPRKPTGNTPKWYFLRWVWELLAGGQFPIAGLSNAQGSVRVEWLNGRYEVSLDRITRPATPTTKHPFQIYRAADTTPTSDDWRKFRVHHGECFLNWSQVTVTGTDNDASPVSILADDATAKYWFWLEVSGGAVSIGHGADPQTFSTSKVPIGYVDTTTSGAAEITLQMLTTNAYLCT